MLTEPSAWRSLIGCWRPGARNLSVSSGSSHNGSELAPDRPPSGKCTNAAFDAISQSAADTKPAAAAAHSTYCLMTGFPKSVGQKHTAGSFVAGRTRGRSAVRYPGVATPARERNYVESTRRRGSQDSRGSVRRRKATVAGSLGLNSRVRLLEHSGQAIEWQVLAENGTAALERRRATSGRSHEYDRWLKATQPGHGPACQATQEPDVQHSCSPAALRTISVKGALLPTSRKRTWLSAAKKTAEAGGKLAVCFMVERPKSRPGSSTA
jgi:hypothetical protein